MSKTIADLIIDYKFDISMLREHSYGETEDDYIRSEGKADKLEEVVQDLKRILEIVSSAKTGMDCYNRMVAEMSASNDRDGIDGQWQEGREL